MFKTVLLIALSLNFAAPTVFAATPSMTNKFLYAGGNSAPDAFSQCIADLAIAANHELQDPGQPQETSARLFFSELANPGKNDNARLLFFQATNSGNGSSANSIYALELIATDVKGWILAKNPAGQDALFASQFSAKATLVGQGGVILKDLDISTCQDK